jgi:hypothetical protein
LELACDIPPVVYKNHEQERAINDKRSAKNEICFGLRQDFSGENKDIPTNCNILV